MKGRTIETVLCCILIKTALSSNFPTDPNSNLVGPFGVLLRCFMWVWEGRGSCVRSICIAHCSVALRRGSIGIAREGKGSEQQVSKPQVGNNSG